MTKIMKARQSTRAVLFPNARDVAAKRKQLPKFQPHDLRDLVREAGGSANNQSDPDWAFALAFRRRNDQQINELLRVLGLDVAHPDVWRRAFFQLAVLHHGVGHLVSKRQQPNRNSAIWQIEQDLKLLQEMMRLLQQGHSERQSIAMLATDPKKREFFPYREQVQRHDPVNSEKDRRIAALRAHWLKLKRQRRYQSLAETVLGSCPTGNGGFE